ncbi:MAG: hypothetical protein AAFY46_04505 [Planctomycetota bacterium]
MANDEAPAAEVSVVVVALITLFGTGLGVLGLTWYWNRDWNSAWVLGAAIGTVVIPLLYLVYRNEASKDPAASSRLRLLLALSLTWCFFGVAALAAGWLVNQLNFFPMF